MDRQSDDAVSAPPNADRLDNRAKVVWYLIMRLKQKDVQIQEMLEREDDIYETMDRLIDYAHRLEHQVAKLVRQKWAKRPSMGGDAEKLGPDLNIPEAEVAWTVGGEELPILRDPHTGAIIESSSDKERIEAGPIGEAKALIQARGTGKLDESELDVTDAELTLAVMKYMGRMKVEKDVEPVLSDDDIDKFFTGLNIKGVGKDKKG